MSTENYFIAALIIFVAYFIRGIAGFGSGLIAVPLLALFLPLTFVVPVVLLLDFTASLVMGGLDFKRVEWNEVIWLVPFSVVGVVLGSQLLTNLPVTPTLIILALFIFIFGVRSLLNIHGEKMISQYWSIPAALTGGTVGALFGTGGPPYVIYLNHRIQDKTKLRATFSALFFMEGLMRIITFFMIGLLLSYTIWWTALGALPILLIGLYLGSHIHTGLSQTSLMRLIGVLLLVASFSLLVKALL